MLRLLTTAALVILGVVTGIVIAFVVWVSVAEALGINLFQ